MQLSPGKSFPLAWGWAAPCVMGRVDTWGSGWMRPQAWQGDGARLCLVEVGEQTPSPDPWLNHRLPAAAESREVGYGHARPGELGVRSWSPAGFGQPFGSRPNFQLEGVTQCIGFPPWPGGSLPSRHCLPGMAGYVRAMAVLASPPAGAEREWAPAPGQQHPIVICARGGTNLLWWGRANARAEPGPVSILDAGAASCNPSPCRLKPCLGFLMSKELSVLQAFLVAMNSAFPDPTKSSDRVKTQVLVCAPLGSGFLNWANTTAPPEHV